MKYDALVDKAEASGEIPPGGVETVFGGVQMLEYRIAAGTVLVSHCHSYDHPAILAQGTAELLLPEGLQTLVGPTVVNIKAGIKHAVCAQTDIVWYCLRPNKTKKVKRG